MEKLGRVYTKTLYQLQELVTLFKFVIVYNKGSEILVNK
jgi:hypothetical protein